MTSHRLKLKLLKDGLKQHKCECCNTVMWNNKPVPVELHHIDGDSSNNELLNLMILCPNCHAQTSNYKSKNRSCHDHSKQFEDGFILNILKDCYSITEAIKTLTGGLRSVSLRKRIKELVKLHSVIFKTRIISNKLDANLRAVRIRRFNKCEDCGCDIHIRSSKCRNCNLESNKSLTKPSVDELLLDIKNCGYVKTGIKYKVSDNTIRKWVRGYGLNPRDINYCNYKRLEVCQSGLLDQS